MEKEILVATLALSGATASVLGNLYWNFQSAKASRKLPFLQRQLELCFEASQVVSTLAVTGSFDEWETARNRFWQLYHGQLAIVEDRHVEECMVECGRLIPPVGLPTVLPVDGLGSASLKLSGAVRRLLIDAWNVQDLDSVLQRRTSIFDEVRQTFRQEYEKGLAKRTS